MAPDCSPRPRPKSSAATRQAMLEAARRRFLAESYENVGLREVAGDAGVDVALVSRYFGSKEELFREVLGVGDKRKLLPPGVASAEVPRYLARLFIEQGAGNEHVERLLIILRSASSPAASKIVREALREDVLEPLARELGGNHPEVRAGASLAVWMGMTIMRTVMTVEPLCSDHPDVEERLEQLFEAALADSR